MMRTYTLLDRQRGIRMAARLGLGAAVVLAGCSDLEPVATFEPVTDATQLYMALTLNYGAVNLSTAAPYDTATMKATPRNALGEPISGLPAPTFHSEDTSKVSVTPDGLLQARRAASGLKVIAELAADGNVRHADTVWVNVTTDSTPPKVETLSIVPTSPSRRQWAVSGSGTVAYVAEWIVSAGLSLGEPSLAMRALDADGNSIPGLQVEYASLDPQVLSIGRNPVAFLPGADPVVISGPFLPGEVRVVVRTLAYGAAKADTAVFTVTAPSAHLFTIAEQPDSTLGYGLRGPGGEGNSGLEVRLRPNGLVFWYNNTTEPMDVTFDDPTNVAEATELCAAYGGTMCGAGDIEAFAAADSFEFDSLVSYRVRRFPVPGVYSFRSMRSGATGRIVVVDKTTP